MGNRMRVSPSLVISVVALFFSLAGVGVAANGGSFILGQANTATSKTSLSAKVGAAALQITNNSLKAGATPLSLNAVQGPPPLLRLPMRAFPHRHRNLDEPKPFREGFHE